MAMTWSAMTERKPPGMSFESWVDSQISRGIARGDFDDLAGAGKPLPHRPGEDSMIAWVLEKARQENIDVFGMLPPGLALRKEKEDLPRRAAVLHSEAAVRALVEDFNDRVRLFWRRPQDPPVVPVGLADADALVAEWEVTRPAPQPEPVVPEPPRRRRFRMWRRERRG
jgi:hypothetical protein